MLVFMTALTSRYDAATDLEAGTLDRGTGTIRNPLGSENVYLLERLVTPSFQARWWILIMLGVREVRPRLCWASFRLMQKCVASLSDCLFLKGLGFKELSQIALYVLFLDQVFYDENSGSTFVFFVFLVSIHLQTMFLLCLMLRSSSQKHRFVGKS